MQDVRCGCNAVFGHPAVTVSASLRCLPADRKLPRKLPHKCTNFVPRRFFLPFFLDVRAAVQPRRRRLIYILDINVMAHVRNLSFFVNDTPQTRVP